MTLTRKILICALASLWLGLTGCGQKTALSPPTNSPNATAATAATEPAVDLAELTQAVRRFGMERQKAAQNLDEVVAAGYLKRLPVAPAGKKFVIEPKRVEVILVNQ